MFRMIDKEFNISSLSFDEIGFIPLISYMIKLLPPSCNNYFFLKCFEPLFPEYYNFNKNFFQFHKIINTPHDITEIRFITESHEYIKSIIIQTKKENGIISIKQFDFYSLLLLLNVRMEYLAKQIYENSQCSHMKCFIDLNFINFFVYYFSFCLDLSNINLKIDLLKTTNMICLFLSKFYKKIKDEHYILIFINRIRYCLCINNIAESGFIVTEQFIMFREFFYFHYDGSINYNKNIFKRYLLGNFSSYNLDGKDEIVNHMSVTIIDYLGNVKTEKIIRNNMYSKLFVSEFNTQIVEALTEQPIVEASTEQPIVEALTEQPIVEASTEQPKNETLTEQPNAEALTKQPKNETFEQFIIFNQKIGQSHKNERKEDICIEERKRFDRKSLRYRPYI
jgi:hypothetical protein